MTITWLSSPVVWLGTEDDIEDIAEGVSLADKVLIAGVIISALSLFWQIYNSKAVG